LDKLTFDSLRQDAFKKRLHGIAGGNRIAWSAKDAALIGDHINGIPVEKLLRAEAAIPRKFVDNSVAEVRRILS
jgi:hypothetical protein